MEVGSCGLAVPREPVGDREIVGYSATGLQYSWPLYHLIKKYVTQDMLNQIARSTERGASFSSEQWILIPSVLLKTLTPSFDARTAVQNKR